MAEKLYNAYEQEIELTAEQQACLKYTGDRTLLVKGFAGSGKSFVLLSIATKYIQKYGPTARNKVAIFTYQNTLVSSTREILKVNGAREDGVMVSTFDAYVKTIYDGLVKEGKAPKRKISFDSDKFGKAQRLKNVEQAIKNHQDKYGKHRLHSVGDEFWLSEFDWMKDMNIWLDDLEYYIQLPRKGRGGKVRMKPADRLVAYQIYESYCHHLEKTKQADWIDQTLFLIRHPDYINDEFKFDHVLIDEAQDLSLAQMSAIMFLNRKDMIVAMDMNQKIHGKYWTPKLLGIDTTTKKLTTSMRTTKEIDALAESVRKINDSYLDVDDKSLRAVPEKNGPLPKLVCMTDQEAERKYVISLIKEIRKQVPNATIGVVAARKDHIKVYSEWFASDYIEHEQVTKGSTFSVKQPGVKVVTAYGAKGLEFDYVIIPQFVEGNFPYRYKPDNDEELQEFLVKMRNLVYVSMTRARYCLYITWYGTKGSRFIAEMNESLYQKEGEPFKPSQYAVQSVVSKKTEDEIGNVAEPVKITSLINKSTSDKVGLFDYLKQKGLDVIDKREKGGALWVIGGKELDPILKETKIKYGAFWTFSAKGGAASGYKTAWFTKCSR